MQNLRTTFSNAIDFLIRFRRRQIKGSDGDGRRHQRRTSNLKTLEIHCKIYRQLFIAVPVSL